VTFHSLDYLAFFGLVVAVYWCLPHRAQNALLLVASYAFYGYIHLWFLIPIAFSTMVDYVAGLAMERDPPRKKLWFSLSLVTNLGLLGTFKYFNFFVENVAAVLHGVGLDVPHVALRLVLPVGISFYTFQSLTYTIDVYRGQVKARRNLLDFALFVCFFPQLVAGPIERARSLLPQMEGPRVFSAQLAREAALLMIWGFFKKLVIADNVGVIANKVFGLENPGFFVLWAGVFAFGMQIYADFSAYSDIARGSARWLGFTLMRNFDHPYIARNPIDFWRRWHIALSSWFRDYVYISLGGSKHGEMRTARNVLITFFLSGLWHGASWNYVLWGTYHGVLVAGYRLGRQLPWPKAAPWMKPALAIGQGVLMFVLAHIGWLMFRETNFDYLLRYATQSPFAADLAQIEAGAYLFLTVLTFSWPIFAHDWIVALTGVQQLVLPTREQLRRPAHEVGVALTQGLVAGVLLTGILVLHSRASLDFIYFAF
jgi:D-alanyl-lipoteichoic acid acyltransferase DltB (MBOAT superfamily)